MTKNNKNEIGVIGLGYVGLPLSLEFSKHYTTIGFDIDESRINELRNNYDKTFEVSQKVLINSKIIFTNSIDKISNCNIYIITVPTPVDIHNNPDMVPLETASAMIGSLLKKDDIVIYESTVYPGATEEFCVPILEKKSKLKYNIDFFCGYSPERINPGDKNHNIVNITKVVSGSNKKTLDNVDNLYKKIIKVGTHRASSIAVAEASKVIENIQRDVNIALINEFSMIFDRLNLDTSEVIKAAETKWNFLSFRPGIVGGHCIGVDPYYLTHRAKELDYHPEIILAGRKINDYMGKFIVDKVLREMTENKINPNGAKIAFFGITFKENCPDLRNTQVPKMINELIKCGCNVVVSDDYAPSIEAKKLYGLELIEIEKIDNCDVVILAVPHKKYKKISISDWKKILSNNGIFIDIKSIYEKDYFSNSTIKHWRL